MTDAIPTTSGPRTDEVVILACSTSTTAHAAAANPPGVGIPILWGLLDHSKVRPCRSCWPGA